MTELDASSGHAEDQSASKIGLVGRQLPFLAILALAIEAWLIPTFRSGLSEAFPDQAKAVTGGSPND